MDYENTETHQLDKKENNKNEYKTLILSSVDIGYNWDTIARDGNIVIKDIYGQIMVDEYPNM